MKRLLALLAIPLLFCATPALAWDALTPAQVEKFVASLDDVQVLTDKLKAEGKNELIGKKIAPPKNGEDFTPYYKAIAILKTDFADDYKKLGEITAKHKFASPEEWALSGDSVMAAFISSKIDPQAEAKMAEAQASITPEMKAKMPPEAIARMEQAVAMIASLRKVPQGNLDAVKPHAAKIEAFMEKQKS